jgi:MFS transporter, SP family, general alpha glucoside:H+ symporter
MATHDDSKVESDPRAQVPYSPEVELIEAAKAASDAESLLPRKELFSRYAPAAIYSMLLSVALVMEGMDVGLINNFFAHPAYLNRFGWPDPVTGDQHISVAWQGAIGAGNNIGSLFGLLLNGYLQSRYGSRRVYMVCAHGIEDETSCHTTAQIFGYIWLTLPCSGRHGLDGWNYLHPLLLHQRRDAARR